MKKDNVLKKYQSRVFKESVIKSIIYGLIFGLAVMALVSLIFFIIGSKSLIVTILLGIVAIVGGSIYVYRAKFRTTVEAIAKRVDELGLHERVITMIDYADNDSLICVKQREDTQEKLEKVESNQIKFRIPKKSLALLAVIAILAGSSLFLPNRGNSVMANSSSSLSISSSSSIIENNSSSSSVNVDDEIDKIIQQLIEEIRRIINNAEISDDAKARLHAVVDDTVLSLENAKTPYEKIQILQDLKADIRHQIELMKSVGKSLEENDVTKDLGQAIQAASNTKDETEIANIINESVDKMLADLEQSDDKEGYINNLIYSLEYALSLATEEENTELMTALSNFVKRLKGEEITEPEVNARRLLKSVPLAEGDDASSSIEDARQEIIDALTPQPEPPEEEHPSDSDNPENPENPEDHPSEDPEGQEPSDEKQEADETQDKIDDAIDDAIGDINDVLDQNGQKPEEPEPGDQPGNGDPDEPSDQEPTDQPVFDTGDLESETVIDGNTPYLDVFEEYYEEIVDYLANNEVPDDLREVIEKYLEMIKNKV